MFVICLFSALSMEVEIIESSGSESVKNEQVEELDTSHESVDAAVDVSPQFYNSSNSTQVLLVLKSKIYFHGSLQIRLLAGNVSIFGYELQQNEPVTANSPRGHSFLCLSPSPQPHHHENDQKKTLELHLKKLTNEFLRTDLKEISHNFDGSTEAVVLLETNTSTSIYMIDNYMQETIFPNVNTFTLRPFHQSETILRSQFLPYTTSGLKINPQWQDILMTNDSRHAIIGGKGVGKSTCLRYLINKNLRQHSKILLIDLDIGQPEMFLPQTVSATIITKPLLGPGYLQNKSPHISYLFGDVNVLVSSIKYLKCVLKLLSHCQSVDEFKSIPWFVNTMGYPRGFGLELIVAILRVLKPTDLIQIQSDNPKNNFAEVLNAEVVNEFRLRFFEEEVRGVDKDCSYSTHICDTMWQSRRKKCWDITPRVLRFAMVLSKLGNILKGNAKWITDVKPLW